MVKENEAGLKHPHDLVVRSILADADIAADLLRNYLDPNLASLLDLQSITCESPVAVDEDLVETMGDLRYMARFKGTGRLSRVFVLVEHQSRSERFFSLRAIEYICKAYWQYLSSPKARKGAKPKLLPYPVVVVLYHGKRPWGKLCPMRDLIASVPGVDMDILRLPICLIDLASIPPGQLKGNPVVRALLDSLQSAAAQTLGDRYEEIASGLKDIREDPRAGSWTKVLTLYAASQSRINGDLDAIRRVYCKVCAEKEAEKMIMTTAEVLRLEGEARGAAKAKQEAEKMIMTTAEVLRLEGEARGAAKAKQEAEKMIKTTADVLRLEGKAAGKVEGKAEGKAEIIIDILTARFGKIPVSLGKKITMVQDSARLSELGKSVITCATLNDFKKLLQ